MTYKLQDRIDLLLLLYKLAEGGSDVHCAELESFDEFISGRQVPRRDWERERQLTFDEWECERAGDPWLVYIYTKGDLARIVDDRVNLIYEIPLGG